MSQDPRVPTLLAEILESDRTPEEVCADAPELLPEVRAQFHRCRRMAAQLDVMFPPSDSPSSGRRGRRGPVPGALPDVPGYHLEGILGRGGMGVVYRARQLNLHRPVALKMLLSGAYASPADLRRFAREAEAIAGLQHANIVQVYDIGELNGRPYFTMELIAGGTLAKRLGGVPQPAREAATLLSKLVAAIAAAHEAGIVHRDMKPANVLIASDGTPKIADFGLAHHVEAAPGLTLTGARVGTPSYMAPEQASGRSGRIGPGADIYALGAILYEMLTGRPPFRGESASETERQLLTEEPAPPSRLNARVPRDLETICLKCLHKDSQKRYATAVALGDDLSQFLDGMPISARRAGPIERGARWARRRPAYATAIACAALLACVLVAGGVWVAMLRADQRNAVDADLRDVMQFQAHAQWPAARAALDHAEARLGPGGPADLRDRLARVRRDLDLVIRLDTIRLTRVTRGAPLIYQAQASQAYADAFADAGLIAPGDAPGPIAARIRASAVRAALVEAVDDWIVCAPNKDQRAWLIDIARAGEDDPDGWRARILDATAWDDRAAVDSLVRDVPVDREPLSLLLVLAERLKAAGGEPWDFVKRVQGEHPADFWANLVAGNGVLFRSPKASQDFFSFPKEAIGYYRAALASRPDAAVGYCVVGDAFRFQNEFDSALRSYRHALEQDPTYARAYTNIGLTLQHQGHFDQAIDNYRTAIRLDPNYAWTYFELGNALRATGRHEEAWASYRTALKLDPAMPGALQALQTARIRGGETRAVWTDWKSSLDADPRSLDDWIGYAQLSLFIGERDEYLRARRQLLDRFGDASDPAVCERTSRACLLMPLDGEDLIKATAMAARAVASKATADPRAYPYFVFAKGLADYRAGRFADSVAAMRGGAAPATAPGPRLLLAMALFRQGDAQAARASLADAVVRFDWTEAEADWRDPWIWHVLRREAEQTILPHLSEFFAGAYWPSDVGERLAMTGACQFAGSYARAARLYREAIDADPGLAEDRGVDHRFNAARFAALAGCGKGTDARDLSEADRTRLRDAALAWLRADLSDLDGRIPAGNAKRRAVEQRLSLWMSSPQLAGVRDPAGLDKLLPGERAGWTDFWRLVRASLSRAADRE